MYISKVITYLDGWKILQENHQNIYQDISNTLKEFTYENLTSSKIGRPYQKENEEKLVSPFSFNRTLDYFLKKKGWKDYRVKQAEKGSLRIFAKNLKDKVSVRLIADDHMSTFSNWLFVECPKLYENEITELSVLLVPEKEIESMIIKRMSGLFSIDRCNSNLQDLSPLKNTAPFVIIGFSQKDITNDLQINLLEPDESVIKINNTIEKSIEFRPEHYQAGMGILSYFGEIIKTKHPDSNAKVKIEQDGNTVRLLIFSPNGDKEIIEKTLEEYSLVISNQAPPSSLLKNELEIMALNNKLEMATMEVRHTRDLLVLSQNTKNKQICSLEEEVDHLRTQIGSQLVHIDKTQVLVSKVISGNDRLIEATINQNNKLIDDLIERAWFSNSVTTSLTHIKEVLERGVLDEDEEDIKKCFSTIQNTSPEILPELKEVLKNTMYGVSGNIMFTWLQSIVTIAF